MNPRPPAYEADALPLSYAGKSRDGRLKFAPLCTERVAAWQASRRRDHLNSLSPRAPAVGSGAGSRSGAGSGPGSSGTWMSGITASTRGGDGGRGGASEGARPGTLASDGGGGTSFAVLRSLACGGSDSDAVITGDVAAAREVDLHFDNRRVVAANLRDRHPPLERIEPAAGRRDRHPAVRHHAVGGPRRIARRPQRARHPFARAAFVAVLALLDLAPSVRRRAASAPATAASALRAPPRTRARRARRAPPRARLSGWPGVSRASVSTRANRSRAESPLRRCA